MSALEQLHPQWFHRVQSLGARVESIEDGVMDAAGRVLDAALRGLDVGVFTCACRG